MTFSMVVVGVAMLLASGCAVRTPESLERVRAQYSSISQNEGITANAPVALYEAQQAVNRAERAWNNTGDEAEVEHLAYLAQQKLDIARVRAQRTQSEKEIEQMSAERQSLLLEARRREALLAREQALAQERAAREAQESAVRAKALAERERMEALARKQEAEEARQRAEEAQRQAKLASAQARELEQKLAELNAKVEETERGLVLTLGDVLFEFDKDDLKPGARRNLAVLVRFLEENRGRPVTVEGHTDSVGSESYNRELSQRRAEAVRNFLVQNGIRPERVSARGLGEAYPVASNDTNVGRQQNRRVEIIISKDGQEKQSFKR